MSHQRKTNRKKTRSSENHLWEDNEDSQPSASESSLKRPGYPNVPKRTRQSLFTDDRETIQTESRITIGPSGPDGLSSNRNAYNRHMLDFMTKYTSPQKTSDEHRYRSSSPIQHELNNPLKTKRTLSPLDETDGLIINESKRTKSFDDNEEDDDELSQLIDHRRTRRESSQSSNTNVLSQVTNDGETRKPTVRKPTVRKLSTNQRKPSVSQPAPIERQEAIIIELDADSRDENGINQETTSWLTQPIDPIEHELAHHVTPTPTIQSPVESFNCNIKPTTTFTPIQSAQQILNNPIDASSPCLNIAEPGVGGRRYSTTSSNSLFFDTPNSSFSRTATNNTTSSTPRNIIKTDRETQMTYPSNLDLINQLISQMNLTSDIIDYNPSELARKFFYQSTPFSSNKKNILNSNKPFLHFGRYEIEVLFPSSDNHKNSSIYACDICLKQFFGSAIAFQRHTAKCLCTQPPGKLVFHTDDLAIFQIGETPMSTFQRIYVKFLCQIARLFMDPNKTIDDTNIDRFVYYILCRRDPICSQSQTPIYRLIGYFSKQLHHQSINNLSCLFILPPFTFRQEYYQLLIDFSYALIRLNASIDFHYSSPARPLDIPSLSAFRIYWRDSLFAYIIHHNHSTINSLALDVFARQTFIHPRDILSSLYSSGLIIVPNSFDKSSVYLKSYSMRGDRNQFLLVTNNEKRILINQQNRNKNDDSGREEIVLD